MKRPKLMVAMNGGRSVSTLMATAINIRKASTADLVDINPVIDAAIMTWDLPERVKRLSLPSYHYTEHDLQTIALMVAEANNKNIVGVAAWDRADSKDAPSGYNTLLLHGIYVEPAHHHQGIGQQLLQAAEQAAIEQGYNALLVKAQASAAGFFLAQGMRPLQVENASRDYAHRYWKPLKP